MPRGFHVVHISFYLDPLGRDPERLLIDWPSLVDVAEAAHRAGCRITVIQAAGRNASIQRNGVEYRFIAPEGTATSISNGSTLARTLRDLRPALCHVHGLGFPVDVVSLARMLPSTPILLQDHADHPPRIWRRLLWRRALAHAAGIAFCARSQSRPFVKLRLLDPSMPIYEIPESSSHFSPGDRNAARAKTGLRGDPCVLWIGHLNDNKDPLTVLGGLSKVTSQLPGLELWCCYAAAPLLNEVTQLVDRDPALGERVHLLGRVDHAHVEQLMRAADIFVLGSHREGSGYALIEALACGLPPVVTNIASFRSLTDGGRIGRLWTCGDAAGFATALLAVANARPSTASVRAHFDAEISFDAVGRKLVGAYEDILARQRVSA